MSLGLLVIVAILGLILGDSRIEELKLDNILPSLLIGLFLLSLGVQILQGFSNGVINFKHEFYRVKNPIAFNIMLWFSLLAWICIGYMIIVMK